MNKLDYKHQPLSLSFAPPSELEPARRLIVLVPYLEADLTSVTRRVWELANATGAHVQFLSLCQDEAQEPSLRRKLVTISAIVNYGNVSAEADVAFGNDWVNAVKSRCQAGDMVVCFAEQRAGLLQKPLSQMLRSNLNVPLYILSGLSPQSYTRSTWPAQTAAWLGSFAIIIGFFVLHSRIDLSAKDWTQSILMLLSIAVEVWVVWIWNSLFE